MTGREEGENGMTCPAVCICAAFGHYISKRSCFLWEILYNICCGRNCARTRGACGGRKPLNAFPG